MPLDRFSATMLTRARKFNPYHDENGLFAESPGGGQVVSEDIPTYGNTGNPDPQPNYGSLSYKLSSAVTDYDRKQQRRGRRGGYNPFALAQYFEAASRAIKETEQGVSLRQALINNFEDRLLDHMLKSVKEPKFDPKRERR